LHLTVAATFWAGMVLLWSLGYVRQPAADAEPGTVQTLKVLGNP